MSKSFRDTMSTKVRARKGSANMKQAKPDDLQQASEIADRIERERRRIQRQYGTL